MAPEQFDAVTLGQLHGKRHSHDVGWPDTSEQRCEFVRCPRHELYVCGCDQGLDDRGVMCRSVGGPMRLRMACRRRRCRYATSKADESTVAPLTPASHGAGLVVLDCSDTDAATIVDSDRQLVPGLVALTLRWASCVGYGAVRLLNPARRCWLSRVSTSSTSRVPGWSSSR